MVRSTMDKNKAETDTACMYNVEGCNSHNMALPWKVLPRNCNSNKALKKIK